MLLFLHGEKSPKKNQRLLILHFMIQILSLSIVLDIFISILEIKLKPPVCLNSTPSKFKKNK